MGDKFAHPSYYLGMSNFNRFLTKGFIFVFAALMLSMNVATAFGAELNVPVVVGTHGEEVTFPVTVDRVDNLAGIKFAASSRRAAPFPNSRYLSFR